jgi:hypothetical protein
VRQLNGARGIDLGETRLTNVTSYAHDVNGAYAGSQLALLAWKCAT